jgi:hypothetical protein
VRVNPKAKAKIWVPKGRGVVQVEFEDIYLRETVMGVERLVVSCRRNWLERCLELVRPDGSEFFCLHEARDEGVRTQSAAMSFDELTQFTSEFREYIECDPSHVFWFFNSDTRRQVVLDEHNLTFVYEDLENAVSYLRSEGFREGSIELPSPHVHFYNKELRERGELLVMRLGADP